LASISEHCNKADDVLVFVAPSIANVQGAIEHIYPLVLQFRMEKPDSRSSAAFRGGSAPSYAQSWQLT